MKREFTKIESQPCVHCFHTRFTKGVMQYKYCNMNILTKYVLNTTEHCSFAPKNYKQFNPEVLGECNETKLANKCHFHHFLAECAVRGGQRNELMQQR